MKKKIFSMLLACTLIVPTFSYSFAVEAPVEPTVPTEQTEETVEQYNKEVDTYNEKVDEYNQQIDNDYEAAQAEYEKQKEDTQIHNQEEEEKVKTNEEQLAKQERINQRIEHDTNNGLENSTDDPEKAPKNFDGETADPKTITVEKSDNPSGKTYKFMNLHVFTETGEFFNDNKISNDSIKLAESLLSQAILMEWEIVTADENDMVYSRSQDKYWGGKQTQFRRCLKEYVNGVWMVSSYIIESDANNQGIDYVDETWIQYVSYNDGTHYNRTPVNTVILWVYFFYRVGPEPKEVEKYEPDMWDEPTIPIKPDYLTKLDYLTFTPADEDPVTPETPVVPIDTDDPTPSPGQKEKVVEKTTKKTSNDRSHAVTVNYTPVTTTNASVEVETQETPKVNVIENATPKAGGQTAYWALINLIAVILTIIINLILFIRFAVKKRERALKVIVALIVSIISVFIFILTENMLNPMILVDKWTLLMIIFLAINVLLWIKRRKKEEKENNEESDE